MTRHDEDKTIPLTAILSATTKRQLLGHIEHRTGLTGLQVFVARPLWGRPRVVASIDAGAAYIMRESLMVQP